MKKAITSTTVTLLLTVLSTSLFAGNFSNEGKIGDNEPNYFDNENAVAIELEEGERFLNAGKSENFLKVDLPSNGDGIVVRMYNSFGVLTYQQTFSATEGIKSLQIEISQLPNGYFYTALPAEKTKLKRKNFYVEF